MELRSYQTCIIKKTRAAMRAGVKRLLVVAPTGSGKTVLVASMMRRAVEKGHRAWFIVHRRELVKQTTKLFKEVGLNHGIIANGFDPTYESECQVASIQTLKNRFDKTDPPTLIFIDEGHHSVAGSWKTLFDTFPEAWFVLLTATPERLDGKGLSGYADQIIEGPSVLELTKQGYLCPYEAYAPSTIDVTGIKKSMGDFQRGALAEAANKPVITGNAVNEYKKLCDGKRAVVFCASVEHSKCVTQAFNAAGIAAEHIDGESNAQYRDEAILRFQNGTTKILSNVELFGEGFDLPSIEACILLRPTQSLALHLQQVGRVLRPSPGKSKAIILDHAGNIDRHGLPDDDRCWDLLGKKEREKREKEKELAVKTCPVCFYVQRAHRGLCVECGSELITAKEREIEAREGELKRIERETLRKKKELQRERKQAGSLEALLEIEKKRGYRPGWARHVYHGRKNR